MPPTILITGGHGLLGSRVVKCFAARLPEGRIIAVGRSKSPRPQETPRVEEVQGDLRDARVWARLPPTITHVVHLAAVIPKSAAERHRASLLTDNLLPLAHLVEHSQSWPDLRQVIYSSSVSVYAPTSEFLREDSPTGPVDLCAASKLAGEDVLSCLDARGVRTVCARLSSLYAHGLPEGTVLSIMTRRAREGQDLVIFGDGTRTQDFLHCEDAARALWFCVLHEAQGVYNVGTGVPVSLTELAQAVSSVYAQGSAKIVYHPATTEPDLGIKLDISRARCELQYEPQLPIRAGLERVRREMDAASQ